MTPPEPMTFPLRHGTVGRFSDAVSMGVVDIASTDQATVQFFDDPSATELRLGRPLHHSGLTVTLLEAHPDPDVRAARLLVEVVPDPVTSGALS